MQLKDIMTQGIVNIPANATCQMAGKLMRDKDIGFLAVTDEQAKVVGVVTDRDLVVRCLAENLDPATPIDSLMSPEVFALSEDTDVAEAAQLLEDKQIYRLLVVGNDETLVGVVTLRDLAQGTHDAELCGHIVEKITAGV